MSLIFINSGTVAVVLTVLAAVALIVAIAASLGLVAKVVGWLFEVIGKGCTYLCGCGCMLLILAVLLAVVAGGCTRRVATDTDDSTPREGDILMQVAAPSEFVDAIVASSAAADTMQFAHCAMLVEAAPDSLVVLEATTPGGVKYTSIDEFLAGSDSIGGRPAVIVMRINDDVPLDVPATVAAARARLGQPYDWSFLPDNGKTYCSELLQTCYVDTLGNHIFDTIPLNFLDADGEIVPYWTELFERLGEPVPQGVAGTSPSSVAHSPRLHVVYRYF